MWNLSFHIPTHPSRSKQRGVAWESAAFGLSALIIAAALLGALGGRLPALEDTAPGAIKTSR